MVLLMEVICRPWWVVVCCVLRADRTDSDRVCWVESMESVAAKAWALDFADWY